MGKSAKVLSSSSGRILACSIAALSLTSECATLAQEAVWTATQSGNWSVPTNWKSGSVPSNDPARALHFAPPGNGAITATNDLPGTFSASSLRFNSASKGLFSLGGNAIGLTGEAPAIVQSGIGNVTLSAPLLLAPSTGGAVTISGSGVGDLTLSGAIAEAGGPASLVIAGQTKLN